MTAAIRRNSRGSAAGLAALAIVLVQGPIGVGAGSTIPNDEHAVTHALNRLAFGGRPGDVARVKQMGLAAWIEAQLRPERLANGDTDARLARLTTITLDSQTIARDYVAPARQERRRRQLQGGQNGPDAQGAPRPMDQPAAGPRAPDIMSETLQRGRQVFAELAEAKLLRAVYSERQLEEVLVDFWFNHFNVFARKGRTEIYVGEYERDAIRPHVLGTFRELLEATAKSPAMLVYLDNWMSADANAAARVDNRLRRPNTRMPQGQVVQNRRRGGLNENYARELLELHTLGVDAGYSQQDVIEVARAFTGWTIGRPDEAGFRFVPAMHDRDAKKVLGQTIPAGGGIEDGENVLDIVARHPATARHIAFKLVQRFISDTPPPSLVDRAAHVFQTTNGNLRDVVRVIVTSPELFAPETYRAKVKTPFEFVVSALRATDADVHSAIPAVRALAGLGMPLYLCQPPTGYDETAATWVSSGALVNRMNFALAIAGGELRGIEIPDLRRLEAAGVRDRVIRDALGGDVSKATLDTMAKATTTEQAIALAIGSPEFQRQ